jgi:hypothetical protein
MTEPVNLVPPFCPGLVGILAPYIAGEGGGGPAWVIVGGVGAAGVENMLSRHVFLVEWIVFVLDELGSGMVAAC